MLLKRAFSFSSRSLQQQRTVVRPPVQVAGIEGKYASALYSSGVKEKTLDSLEKDLRQVKNLYDTNNEFKSFIDNPLLNKLKKKEAVEAVLKKQGISQQAQNFFGILAESGRINKLPIVVNSFETIMRAHRGELHVEVASAEILNKKHEQALSDALQKFATRGQKLNLTFAVKPNLVGGLVVNIGDKYIDLSMASRLKKLDAVVKGSI
ncbi:hypothetical protein GPALN_001861 [Globodera pallida]|uniref:ATP synthase peripheral stalk subunit OSCP, mitochondrial n=1 Tax=Globodera pallida TaxID=36090 RepID=A0A183C6M5_GLOPA|nr:hypothetical protein GPALN_001861 [Globodera pallida]